MNRGVQLACAWCGPLFAAMLFIGMLMAGLLPPPSPSHSSQTVAEFWRDHTDLTRFGLLLLLVGAGVTVPFSALLCVMIRRIESRDSPLTYIQMLGAAGGFMAVTIPAMIFMVAAFRPDRDPELTNILNDLAWVPFIVNFPPALLQCGAIAVATLSDRRHEPTFPRWVGYYNLWTMALFLPGGLIIFFKSGPFAWNGLIAFWVVAVLFGAWFIVMSVVMTRAVNTHAAANDVWETTGG